MKESYFEQVEYFKIFYAENITSKILTIGSTMTKKFSTTLIIDAEPAKVWATLTSPELMVQWMGEAATRLEVQTNWEVNSPIVIRGFHHVTFENKGIVLKNKQEQLLSYSHLSSVSRLPDIVENYTILEFVLTPNNKQTMLTLSLFNFPTETIQKHLEFYWRGTVHKIKAQAEALIV